ncbi:Hypothetical predicted protein, partial [Paramuricea clavata]
MGDICVVEQPETEIHLEEMTALSRSEDITTKMSTMLNNSTGESTINNSNSTAVMNMNGRILERNEPPYNILSTAGLINTSGNITTNASVANPAESNNAIGSISVNGVQASNNDRLVGHFISENVFNLSHKVLNETEISVLSKGLQFVPTTFKIDEEDLRKDFNEFTRRMRNKWHFRDNVTADFSEIPAFRPKSTWTPPKGCPSLELFLSQIEKELFECVPQKLWKHNLSKIEWLALKTLTEDNSIIIKPADKGSCVVVWDRDDYLAEGYSQLSENNVYTKMERFSEETVMSLTEESNNMFHKLYNQGCISKDEFKYFSYDFKNSCALGRLYLLPKIHKRLRNVPGRPVISNCGTPTERASEFLDHHLKPIMKAGKSYIRDTGHFLDKLKEI